MALMRTTLLLLLLVAHLTIPATANETEAQVPVEVKDIPKIIKDSEDGNTPSKDITQNSKQELNPAQTDSNNPSVLSTENEAQQQNTIEPSSNKDATISAKSEKEDNSANSQSNSGENDSVSIEKKVDSIQEESNSNSVEKQSDTSTETKAQISEKEEPDSNESSNEKTSTEFTEQNVTLSRKQLYQVALETKRKVQIEGVKKLLLINDMVKQSRFVQILFEKLFPVLDISRHQIATMNYVPGGEFPEDEKDLDALGNVFENVCLFGDIVLRLPDITHSLYNKNNKWKVLMNWALLFTNETGIMIGKNKELINLMGQELKIFPKDPNYVNPYREANRKAQARRAEEEARAKRKKEEEEKKKKKKKKRGPRLGGHREL